MKKKCLNLQNTAINYDSSSILAPKHEQITFLLLKVETSRFHSFEAFDYPVQKKDSEKF